MVRTKISFLPVESMSKNLKACWAVDYSTSLRVSFDLSIFSRIPRLQIELSVITWVLIQWVIAAKGLGSFYIIIIKNEEKFRFIIARDIKTKQKFYVTLKIE